MKSMVSIDSIKAKLKAELKPSRYEHSLRVYEAALELAEHYGLPKDKVALAAILHDCGRKIAVEDSIAKAKEFGLEIDFVEEHQPILLHQKLGAYFAEHEYGVKDIEILEAIRRHSVGGKNLSELAQIIYLADLVEAGRKFPGVEDLRKVTWESLNQGMLAAYAHTIKFLLDTKQLVHPDCVEGYNQLLSKDLVRG